MKIYSPGARPNAKRRIHFKPGLDHPENSDWMQRDGKTGQQVPKQLTVEFVGGVAVVDANLGRYMVKKGLAAKSPLLLPHSATGAGGVVSL